MAATMAQEFFKRHSSGLISASAVLIGSYAIANYLATAAGYLQIGALTSPLAPGLKSQPTAIHLHAILSGSALIVCGLQIQPSFRRWTSPRTHKLLGRFYALFVAVGSASALALSRRAVGGLPSTVAFACLAVAWAGTTAAAIYAARGGRHKLHARLMTHSAALAYSAVTLRTYLPFVIFSKITTFERGYTVIAWACWLPNILLVELWYWYVGGGANPSVLLTNMPGASQQKTSSVQHDSSSSFTPPPQQGSLSGLEYGTNKE